MAFFKKELNKFVHEIGTEFSNKPEIYRVVGLLKIELEAEINKKALHEDVLNAAKQLHARLREAMEDFDQKTTKKEGINILEYQSHVQNFAEECHSAIFTYQPTLMSAPGFWNQIKAYINNFLEQYLAMEPFFNTERSVLGLKASFSKSFNDAKRELTPKSDATDSCLFSSSMKN